MERKGKCRASYVDGKSTVNAAFVSLQIAWWERCSGFNAAHQKNAAEKHCLRNHGNSNAQWYEFCFGLPDVFMLPSKHNWYKRSSDAFCWFLSFFFLDLRQDELPRFCSIARYIYVQATRHPCIYMPSSIWLSTHLYLAKRVLPIDMNWHYCIWPATVCNFSSIIWTTKGRSI